MSTCEGCPTGCIARSINKVCSSLRLRAPRGEESVDLNRGAPPAFRLQTCLKVGLFIKKHIFSTLSPYLLLHCPVCQSVSLSVRLPVPLSAAFLSVSLSVCLPARPPARISVCLSASGNRGTTWIHNWTKCVRVVGSTPARANARRGAVVLRRQH